MCNVRSIMSQWPLPEVFAMFCSVLCVYDVGLTFQVPAFYYCICPSRYLLVHCSLCTFGGFCGRNGSFDRLMVDRRSQYLCRQ